MCGSRAQKSMVYWSSCKEEVKTFIMRHLQVTNVPAGISICRKEVLEAVRPSFANATLGAQRENVVVGKRTHIVDQGASAVTVEI